MQVQSGSQLAILLLLAVVSFVNINAVPRAQAPSQDVLKELFDNTFGPPPENVCKCVPYYLCENGTVITDGAGLIDVRVKEDDCPHVLEVCCNAEQTIDPAKQRCPEPIGRRGCGRRNDQGVGFRILGDDEAQFAEFPWMIGLLEKEDSNLVYKCGGSLIHEQVVLTAAHCVVNRNPEHVEIYARAGEWDTQSTVELYPHQQKRVKKIIIHEKYYSAALFNDIALLILEEPFTFADNVEIICLPKTVHDHSESTNCFASGWGKDKFEKGGEYKVILKKVELPMVPHKPCQEKLRTTRLGKDFRLHETFVCAGGIPGLDTCKGDGGSPLVCPVEGKPGTYKQVGMVAWGIGCGTDVPGVYVNVPHFKDWIDHKMAGNNFATEYNYDISPL